jgi:uncharacterized protein with NAD-binding domain and iron-sulfur cluster
VQHAGAIADLDNLRNTLMTSLKIAGDVPAHELAFFVQRELVIANSCEERRIGQWEKQSWMEFVKAKGKSAAYQKYLVSALTRATVAAKPDMGSARTIGQIGLALVTSATGLISQYAGTIVGGGVDRILNAPTNHAWIDPWVAYLSGRGVRFVMGQAATGFDVQGGRITGARVAGDAGATSTVTADWYVAAMPLDRLKPLLRPDLLAAAPAREGINHLVDDWMVGIQYFLSRRSEVVPSHIAALGTPWALTGLFQAAPWEVDFGRIYGDGRVHDCLSVDISDWDTPGILYGKTAKQCTKDEVAKEVWAQMSRALNRGSKPILRDEELVSWHLDPGITWEPAISNATPLMVNTADSYRHRPTADATISNFFIGGDHVRTNIDLATMEGANESGRRVANAILDAAGSNAALGNSALGPVATADNLLDVLRQRLRRVTVWSHVAKAESESDRQVNAALRFSLVDVVSDGDQHARRPHHEGSHEHLRPHHVPQHHAREPRTVRGGRSEVAGVGPRGDGGPCVRLVLGSHGDQVRHPGRVRRLRGHLDPHRAVQGRHPADRRARRRLVGAALRDDDRRGCRGDVPVRRGGLHLAAGPGAVHAITTLSSPR